MSRGEGVVEEVEVGEAAKPQATPADEPEIDPLAVRRDQALPMPAVEQPHIGAVRQVVREAGEPHKEMAVCDVTRNGRASHALDTSETSCDIRVAH